MNRIPEIHLCMLRVLESNHPATQRELAQELGVSLGKANYCLKALIDRGWVKFNNLRKLRNKGFALTCSLLKVR